MEARKIEYRACPTLAAFHLSPAFVRGIRGPVGSGKSTACSWELHRRARQQARAPTGKRKTRFAVVRNTYRELADTTLKTWLDWFPEEIVGKFNHQDMAHYIAIDDVECEVLFRALDRPDDIKKVLSLELTGAWINEAREIPKGIVDALGDRVGRYPSMRDGGCTWRGVVMDTNSPEDDHWWYRLAEEERPEGWAFFTQPGGLIESGGRFIENPAAENIANLEPGYYRTRAAGKSRDYVLVYYANQYGFVKDGRPVYPEYKDAIHSAKDMLKPVAGLPIYVGIDFGLTPAAVLGQRTVSGQWRWFDELVTENMGAVQFSKLLAPRLREYHGFEFRIFGDPAGDSRAQTDEQTPFMILKVNGIDATAAGTNDPVIRREAVAGACSRMIDGEPGLMVSPKCRVTRKGMAGGYGYRRLQVGGEERYADYPDKNRYSHPCEAAQYMMIGAGEGDQIIRTKTKPTKIKYPELGIV